MAAVIVGNFAKLALAVGVVLGGAMIGQEMSPSVAANAKTKAGGKGPKRVCRIVTPTGSRLVERICRTQEEWDYNEKKAQDALLKSQMDDQVRPVPPAI
ncbi:MAG TPA: hypothetical protein VIT45_13005 [Allosphingosinicella sp.]